MTPAAFIRLLVSVVFVTVSLSCGGGGESPTSPTSAPAGTYTLVLGNGQALPIHTGITDGNCTRFIDSGTLALSAAGDYEFRLPMHAVCPLPGGGTNTVTNTPQELGAWSTSGPALTLRHSRGSVLNASNGSLANGSVTITVQYEWAGQLPSVVLVLRK